MIALPAPELQAPRIASGQRRRQCKIGSEGLASAREMREDGDAAELGFRPMRALVFTCLVSFGSFAALSGCADSGAVRVQSFTPKANGTFVYSARTNTVMTPNDDGTAEQIRRGWLAQTLGAQGMCNGGYVVYRRQLVVPPQRPAFGPPPGNPAAEADADLNFGNDGDVVYAGSCL
jgi:hypothetical protein